METLPHGCSAAVSGGTILVGVTYDDIGTKIDQGSAWAFLLDEVAPVTSSAVVPHANSAGCHKTPVHVALSASDDLTGVASTEYRLAGASGWTPYTVPFPVGIQGAST